MFCRYDLRTTDLDAGKRFYEALGVDFGATSIGAWALHENARARGAPAHWLGQIAVRDVEATAQRLVELGSERLGPTVRTNDGTMYATLRDPCGAVVAVREVREAAAPSSRTPVAWHQLHTRDLERSWAVYSELFGWRHTTTIDVPDPVGGHFMFAWDASGKSVGSVANTARWPGVHPHWAFYFQVPDLERALALVREHGGRVIGEAPAALTPGMRIAPCEDPQGAAFGLLEKT